MPRGFRKDNTETMARNFQDPRSFVSMTGHDVLFGDDKRERRSELVDRSKGRCELRKSPQCWIYVSGTYGHWHHIKTKVGEHCDCLDNAAFACPACHALEHAKRRPRWSKKNEVAEPTR